MNEPQKATDKAKDLVRFAVAKVALAYPLGEMSLPINPAALVVGGGRWRERTSRYTWRT